MRVIHIGNIFLISYAVNSNHFLVTIIHSSLFTTAVSFSLELVAKLWILLFCTSKQNSHSYQIFYPSLRNQSCLRLISCGNTSGLCYIISYERR